MSDIPVLLHGHHNILLSWGITLEERIAEIKGHKPLKEQPLRLRVIQDVTAFVPKNDAWEALVKAREAYLGAREAYVGAQEACDKAWAAYVGAREAVVKAQEACDKAWAAYDRALPAHDRAREAYLTSFDVEAFHREHCVPDCPWDGHTIFPQDQP